MDNQNTDVNTNQYTPTVNQNLSHRGGTVGTMLSLPVPAGLSQSPSDKNHISTNQSWSSSLHGGTGDAIRT